MIEVTMRDGTEVQIAVHAIKFIWPNEEGGCWITLLDDRKFAVQEDAPYLRVSANKVLAGKG